MRGKLYIVRQHNRAFLRDLLARAPEGYEMVLRAPTRTLDQNKMLWSLLAAVADAEPMGRKHTPDEWKAIFMQACGWEQAFLPGLSGGFFPVGFRSSRLTKAQMADLITFILSWAAEQGIDLEGRYAEAS